MTRRFLTALLAVILLLGPALARAFTPYQTHVQGRDIGSARLVYGDDAAAGIRDALPAFTDVAAYEFYYKFDDDNNCDDQCLSAPYHSLKRQGRIKMLTVGTTVLVVGTLSDPQDSRFEICRIRLNGSGRTWLTLCSGLADQ